MKPTKEYNGRSRIRMYNWDCMEFMKTGSWDLSIVDPPYGIGANKMTLGNGKRKVYRGATDWDNNPPDKNYFSRLFTVS